MCIIPRKSESVSNSSVPVPVVSYINLLDRVLVHLCVADECSRFLHGIAVCFAKSKAREITAVAFPLHYYCGFIEMNKEPITEAHLIVVFSCLTQLPFQIGRWSRMVAEMCIGDDWAGGHFVICVFCVLEWPCLFSEYLINICWWAKHFFSPQRWIFYLQAFEQPFA